MFEFITNSEERGQVGIGTLIVFIAMVLVAAIAAGVLINTAGFLQTQAEATGQDSTDLVSERIDVSSSVGIVSSSNTEELEQVRLTVSGAPGASDIDLSDTTIQAVGPGGQENLVFADGGTLDTGVSTPGTDEIDAAAEYEVGSGNLDVAIGTLSTGSGEVVEIENAAGETIEQDVSTSGGSTVSFDPSTFTTPPSDGEDITVRLLQTSGGSELDSEVTAVVDTPVSTVGDLSANEFAVEDNGNFQDSAVLGSQDQYTIVLNPQVGALENNQNPNNAFGQGDSATLDLVSPAGAATQVELRAPDLFNEKGEAVRL